MILLLSLATCLCSGAFPSLTDRKLSLLVACTRGSRVRGKLSLAGNVEVADALVEPILRFQPYLESHAYHPYELRDALNTLKTGLFFWDIVDKNQKATAKLELKSIAVDPLRIVSESLGIIQEVLRPVFFSGVLTSSSREASEIPSKMEIDSNISAAKLLLNRRRGLEEVKPIVSSIEEDVESILSILEEVQRVINMVVLETSPFVDSQVIGLSQRYYFKRISMRAFAAQVFYVHANLELAKAIRNLSLSYTTEKLREFHRNLILTGRVASEAVCYRARALVVESIFFGALESLAHANAIPGISKQITERLAARRTLGKIEKRLAELVAVGDVEGSRKCAKLLLRDVHKRLVDLHTVLVTLQILVS